MLYWIQKNMQILLKFDIFYTLGDSILASDELGGRLQALYSRGALGCPRRTARASQAPAGN